MQIDKGSHLRVPVEAFATRIKMESSNQCSF